MLCWFEFDLSVSFSVCMLLSGCMFVYFSVFFANNYGIIFIGSFNVLEFVCPLLAFVVI